MRELIAEQRNKGSELQLWTNIMDGDLEYELVVNGVFIMATYNRLSSELLVRHGIKGAVPKEKLKVLIGGLGMGFSVREACLFPRVDKIDVVEIEPAIASWNRTYLKDINQKCLSDPRVHVNIADFFQFVMNTSHKYHIICMDIDNGPMMLAKESNHRVYRKSFFQRINDILKPGGVFGVWSCNPDQNLIREGESVFPQCTMETVWEEHQGRQVPYCLYYYRNGAK